MAGRGVRVAGEANLIEKRETGNPQNGPSALNVAMWHCHQSYATKKEQNNVRCGSIELVRVSI